ncbi:MAG: hypothetical protein KDA42_12160, partial [Planctomycetales bacterium]|nr:hypothetical protein [Planctomycetales bacterium]
MQTLLRITILGIFASAGVALAIGVAMSTPDATVAKLEGPPIASSGEPSERHQEAPRDRIPFADEAANDQIGLSEAAQLQPQPPVTQNRGVQPALNLNPTSMGDVFNMIGPLIQQISKAQAESAVAQSQLQMQRQGPFPAPDANALQAQVAPPSNVTQANTPRASDMEPRTVIRKPADEGDDSLSITIQGEDIRKVLELLSEQGGLNILASRSVSGLVSATLQNVDIETALDAILKSTGYVWRRDGQFIFVGTPADFDEMNRAVDSVSTRLYRLNYIRAAELQTLVTPLLTPEIGNLSVTSESETGIGAGGDEAGGDGYAGQEAVLVRDYEAVLLEIDQIVAQMDRRPAQVQIEAMILSVRLDDTNELGVDFEVLRDKANVRLASGNPISNLANLDFSDGGLKVGFLDSSLSVLLSALETIGDTNVIATPRLMCLNKHRAEILIGSQLGYVSTTQTETSTTQSVEFL